MKNSVRIVLLLLVLFFSISLAACNDLLQSNQQIVDAVYDQLDVIYQSPDDHQDSVTTHVTLVTIIDEIDIIWSSSHPSVISPTGNVTRQQSNTTVTLTATITKNDVTRIKTFDLIVMSTAFSYQDHTLVTTVKNELSIGYAIGDHKDYVTRNVTLPTLIQGVSISWATSHSQMITTLGVVTRTNENTTVTLTATLTKGVEVQTKTFELLVIRQQTTLDIQKPTSHDDVSTHRDTLNLSYQQPGLNGIKLNTFDKITFFNSLAGTQLIAPNTSLSIQMDATFEFNLFDEYYSRLFDLNTLVNAYQFNAQMKATGVYGQSFADSSLMGQIIFNGHMDLVNEYGENTYSTKHSLALDSDFYLSQSSMYIDGFYKLYGNHVAEAAQMKHEMEDYAVFLNSIFEAVEFEIPNYDPIPTQEMSQLLDLVESLDIYKDGSKKYILHFENNDDIKAISEYLFSYESDRKIMEDLFNHNITLTLVIEDKKLTYIYIEFITPDVETSIYERTDITGKMDMRLEIKLGDSISISMPSFNDFEEDGMIDFSPFAEAFSQGELIDTVINDGLPVVMTQIDEYDYYNMQIPVHYIYEDGYRVTYVNLNKYNVDLNTLGQQTVFVDQIDIDVEVIPELTFEMIKGVYRIQETYPEDNIYKYLYIVKIGGVYNSIIEESSQNFTDEELIGKYNNLDIDSLEHFNTFIYNHTIDINDGYSRRISYHHDYLLSYQYININDNYINNDILYTKVQGQTEFKDYVGPVDYYITGVPETYDLSQGLSNLDEVVSHIIYSDLSEVEIPFSEANLTSYYFRGIAEWSSQPHFEINIHVNYKNIFIDFSVRLANDITEDRSGFYAIQYDQYIKIINLIPINGSVFRYRHGNYLGDKSIEELTLEDLSNLNYYQTVAFITDNMMIYEYQEYTYTEENNHLLMTNTQHGGQTSYIFISSLPRYLIDEDYVVEYDSQAKTSYEMGEFFILEKGNITIKYNDGDSYDVTDIASISSYSSYFMDSSKRIYVAGDHRVRLGFTLFGKSLEAYQDITVTDQNVYHTSRDVQGYYYQIMNGDDIEVLEFAYNQEGYVLKIYTFSLLDLGTELTIEAIVSFLEDYQYYYWYQSTYYLLDGSKMYFQSHMMVGEQQDYVNSIDYMIDDTHLYLSNQNNTYNYYYLGEVHRYLNDYSYQIEVEPADAEIEFYLGSIVTKEDLNFYAVYSDERILIEPALIEMDPFMILEENGVTQYVRVINGNQTNFTIKPSMEMSYLETHLIEGIFYNREHQTVMAIGDTGFGYVALVKYQYVQHPSEDKYFVRDFNKNQGAYQVGVSGDYLWMGHTLTNFTFDGVTLVYTMGEDVYSFEYVGEAYRFFFDLDYSFRYEDSQLKTTYRIGEEIKHEGLMVYIEYQDGDSYLIQPDWYDQVYYNYFNDWMYVYPSFANRSVYNSYVVYTYYDEDYDLTKDILGVYEILHEDYKEYIMIHKERGFYHYLVRSIRYGLYEDAGNTEDIIDALLRRNQYSAAIFVSPDSIYHMSLINWNYSLKYYEYQVMNQEIILDNGENFTFSKIADLPFVAELYFDNAYEVKVDFISDVSYGDPILKEDVRVYFYDSINELEIDIPSEYYETYPTNLLNLSSHIIVVIMGEGRSYAFENYPEFDGQNDDYVGFYFMFDPQSQDYSYVFIVKIKDINMIVMTHQVSIAPEQLTTEDIINIFKWHWSTDRVFIKNNVISSSSEQGTINWENENLVLQFYSRTYVLTPYENEIDRYIYDHTFELEMTNQDIYQNGEAPFNWSNHQFTITYDNGETFVLTENLIWDRDYYYTYNRIYIQINTTMYTSHEFTLDSNY